MNASGKHIAILVDNYFEQAELEEPLTTLREAGAEVTIIATKDKKLQAMQHAALGDTFTADLLLDQASPDDYDALILPGGAINADTIRINDSAQRWVVDFIDDEKPLAVICHAAWLLVSADVVEGRRLTSYYTIRDDIVNAGGEWLNESVVIDGTIITSRQPDDIPDFVDAIVRMLNHEAPGNLQSAAETILSDSEFKNEDDYRLRAQGYDKKRDGISPADERDILSDEDETDSDESRLSNLVANSQDQQ
jgi:protease I